MDYENGYNDPEEEEEEQSTSMEQQNTQELNRSLHNASMPRNENSPISGVKNKVKQGAKHALKEAARVVGAAVRKVFAFLATSPVFWIVLAVAIVVIALICWVLAKTSANNVTNSVEDYVAEAGESIDATVREEFEKKSSMLTMKLSDIDAAYDKYMSKIDYADRNTYEDMQRKYANGNLKSKPKQGEVRSSEDRELFKHILLTEKYNFNDIEWGEYTHEGKNGSEPSMEVNKETGLRYPKKEGKGDQSYDEKYFVNFAYPYLQNWQIPLAMYSGSLSTSNPDESKKNGQFAYQIISKAYSDILINKFVLQKKTNTYQRFEYDIYEYTIYADVACIPKPHSGVVGGIVNQTCIITNTYTDEEPHKVDSVYTDDELIGTRIDETTQYKLIRALTFDKAFNYEYQYIRYNENSEPSHTNIAMNDINDYPQGKDPYTGYSYVDGRNTGAIGEDVTGKIRAGKGIPIGHFSKRQGSKIVTTKIWEDKLNPVKATGDGEPYQVKDVEAFINNTKYTDTTTTGTAQGGGTVGTLTPEQIKALAGTGMFVWPIPSQIGKYEKTYGDTDGMDDFHPNGVITSWVGYRVHPISGTVRDHDGLDIRAMSGEDHSICAAKAGTVTLAGWNGGYGNCVVIQHADGYSTLYGHLSSISVGEGQQVSATQQIGIMGNTGASAGTHLHFEVKLNGERLDGAQFFNNDLTSVTAEGSDTTNGTNNGSGNSTTKPGVTAQNLIDKAKEELGKTDGNKYGSGDWCHWFVSWCAKEVGIGDNVIPQLGYCPEGVTKFQEWGRWKSPDGYTPKAGDIIYFDKVDTDDNPGHNGTADHVGIVLSVDNNVVRTIEGNAGFPSKVREVTYPINSQQILGYGVLDLNASNSSGSGSSTNIAGTRKLTEKATEYYQQLADQKKLDRLDFINATSDIYKNYVTENNEYDENIGWPRGYLSYSYSLLRELLGAIGSDPDNLPFVYGQSLGLNTKHTSGFNGSSNIVGAGIFNWPLPAQVGTYKMIDYTDPLGVVSSWFGPREAPTAGASTNHGALDIVPKNTDWTIGAAANGTVIRAGWNNSGYGNWVVIDHGNGYFTLYGHMVSTPVVSEGQQVTTGQALGTVGSTGYSTGPHLHFGIYQGTDWSSSTAVNPTDFFNEDLSPKGSGTGQYPNIEGDDVERWRPYVQQALAEVKANTGLNIPQTDDAVRRTLAQIRIESGGNPSAINRWDSNASFDCSIGLIQCISTTFNAYCRPGAKAYPVVGNEEINPNDSRLNGYENIYACIYYCAVNYGEDLSKWPTSGGY